jgi:arabinose-5-phosphate isomerase
MSENNHIKNARTVIDIEIEALRKGRDRIGKEFSDAMELIRDVTEHGRVVVMGMGKSGHIGNKIAATLASTGTPAFFVHPAEAGHGDLGMITKNDVVIAISQSGKSDELLRVVPYFKRNGIKLIALTGGLNSQLAENADLVIDTTVPQEACPLGLAPTASTTLTLALGDALAVCLLKASGFTQNNFAETHPHGTLGRRLLVGVSDVMSKGDQVPVIKQNLVVKDALLTMSKGGMGFVVIVDAHHLPIGVFTDGDLRRCLHKDIDIKFTPITEVMQKHFITVQDSQLAVEAVALMELHKISALPVLGDAGDLVGALNMRQLLQAGVV